MAQQVQLLKVGNKPLHVGGMGDLIMGVSKEIDFVAENWKMGRELRTRGMIKEAIGRFKISLEKLTEMTTKGDYNCFFDLYAGWCSNLMAGCFLALGDSSNAIKSYKEADASLLKILAVESNPEIRFYYLDNATTVLAYLEGKDVESENILEEKIENLLQLADSGESPVLKFQKIKTRYIHHCANKLLVQGKIQDCSEICVQLLEDLKVDPIPVEDRGLLYISFGSLLSRCYLVKDAFLVYVEAIPLIESMFLPGARAFVSLCAGLLPCVNGLLANPPPEFVITDDQITAIDRAVKLCLNGSPTILGLENPSHFMHYLETFYNEVDKKYHHLGLKKVTKPKRNGKNKKKSSKKK